MFFPLQFHIIIAISLTVHSAATAKTSSKHDGNNCLIVFFLWEEIENTLKMENVPLTNECWRQSNN